jgi:integrase
VPTLAARFEAKVHRSGDHHIWLGARDASGAGQLRVDGRLTTARRVAWELAHGPLPLGAKVRGCPHDPACVRISHLGVAGGEQRPKRGRAPKGGGSKTMVRPGVWKLTVSAGRYANGSPRRLHRTVHAPTEAEATRALAEFVVEARNATMPNTTAERDITVDEAVQRYLTEHLQQERGREQGTIDEYRGVHVKWFSPEIGHRRLRDIDEATIDRLFGRMREAGLSRSRMNAARNLYAPIFRWARRRGIVRHNPMAEFQLPTSLHVARERVPPEAEQLSRYLAAALELVPQVAPVLTLGAVTGMRRGELVSIRRSGLDLRRGRLRVDTAVAGKRVKTTKTRVERDVALDDATVGMLERHCADMDERAALFGVEVPADAFVFSLEPDCSLPMPAEYLTRRVSVLKEHLGISTKGAETIALEDEALRLFRQPPRPRPPGKRGPAPKGGMSFPEIGRQLGRSQYWAQLAVRSALRREEAAARGETEFFDGSILALRKFTSSELLDAGFNISLVAQRQGHGPQVLVKHYARSRPSAERKAAEHLGQVVHGADVSASRTSPET